MSFNTLLHQLQQCHEHEVRELQAEIQSLKAQLARVEAANRQLLAQRAVITSQPGLVQHSSNSVDLIHVDEAPSPSPRRETTRPAAGSGSSSAARGPTATSLESVNKRRKVMETDATVTSPDIEADDAIVVIDISDDASVHDMSDALAEPSTSEARIKPRPAAAAGLLPPNRPERKFVTSVRKKEDRDKLKGRECEDCRKFYEIVSKGMDADQRVSLVNQCSRHRSIYSPPGTPPGFWATDFDSPTKTTD